MKKLVLTRYLYEKSEVEISLINSLLTKHLDEALFWIYEYHFSGVNAFHLLWKIYYDFYCSNNPKLENLYEKT